ncbi:MAG: trypsin-like peptidase domain-containing protein [Acidimicrobiia bacterium]
MRIPARSHHRISSLAVAVVVLLAISLGACGKSGSSTTTATSTPATTSITVLGDAPGLAEIPSVVEHVASSVVSVITDQGEGSGVIWSQDGIIVTNDHVVQNASSVEVTFADGKSAKATVQATDVYDDLAVVKADRTDLPAAQFAQTMPPVGTPVVAIGNPLGFENSVTQGIISGTRRAIPGANSTALVDLVQTDAAISPGNSGGALVSLDEKVVGITVAYIPPQARAVNLGFAIPAPTVTSAVRQLLDTGKVRHAYLGVRLAPVTPTLNQRFGLGVTSGAVVVQVEQDGPAAQAGVQPGEVITSVGGNDVAGPDDVIAAIHDKDPGDTLDMTISRNGQSQTLTATLAGRSG